MKYNISFLRLLTAKRANDKCCRLKKQNLYLDGIETQFVETKQSV